MDFFSVLTMLGGLALFLYGMHVLGEGLSKASGGRMEQILERLTSGRLRAVFLGAAVTAVIQSSSATTVMVVGFVNSGIMKLSSAIGIIMGANIGTTVTSWLLSLSGIDNGNFWIQLLKPSSFSPVLAIAGVMILLFSKRDSRRNIATIFVGFAVLMFGMDTMSGAVKPLADVPEFANLLLIFKNPFLGILAGAVLTAILQSSSASVGILQALCATGAVSYGTAVPIILGQNIGTCVTALLSSVGTSKNARRAAIVHLYFNLIGTAAFLVVFYGLHQIIGFPFIEHAAQPYGIAIAHSVFNIFATCLLLPFSEQLEKLAYLTIKEDAAEHAAVRYVEEDIRTLDIRFMNNPAVAMEQCRKVTAHMADTARNACERAAGLLHHYTEEEVERVRQMEEDVDRYEDVLGTYLLRLSGRELAERDSRTLTLYLHSIGDLERISDHAVSIASAYQEMADKQMAFSSKAQEELAVFTRAVERILALSLEVFVKEDGTYVYEVEALHLLVDRLAAEVRKRHIKRLRKGKCTIELGFLLSDIVTAYERITAHCVHIAVRMVQVQEDSLEMHGYSDELEEQDRERIHLLYEGLVQEFLLP